MLSPSLGDITAQRQTGVQAMPYDMSKQNQIAFPTEPAGEPDWLELVRQHVGSLRYGVVQIVVHDAQVTQIEKTERVRLEKPRPDSR